jgi:uncharacterized membrane protein
MSTIRALPTAVLLAVMAGTWMGCGSDDDDHGHDEPEVSCTGTIPTYDEVEAFDKCTTCHSSALTGTVRNGATVGVDFDTEAGAEAHAEEIVHEVSEGAMPPPPTNITLSAAEKDELYKWALCAPGS